MFQPCNCCGCTLYSSALSNAAQFDSFDDGAKYVSKFTLPEPDYQIWYGNLLSNTFAANMLFSDWLYQDGRWFKLELVENPESEAEVVHFEQTFRTARQTGFLPGELFADPVAQASLTSGAGPATLNAHILYSEGSQGQILHSVKRYIVGSTPDGYIVDDSFTQRPMLHNPWFRVRQEYVESVPAFDSRHAMGVLHGGAGGVSFNPFEYRGLPASSTRLHLRLSFSEPKDGIISWGKIQNADRDRPETCQQNETCPVSPRRNKPKFNVVDFAFGEISQPPLARKVYSACTSSLASVPLSFSDISWAVAGRLSVAQYRVTYDDGVTTLTPHFEARSVTAENLLLPLRYSIEAAQINLLASSEAGHVDVGVGVNIRTAIAHPQFGLGYLDFVGGSTVDRVETNTSDYAWASPSIYTDPDSVAGWDYATFGDPPPLDPTSHIRFGHTITSIELWNDRSKQQASEFNVWDDWGHLLVPYSRSFSFRKTIPIYEGLDPPEIEFTGADLVPNGDAFNDSSRPGLPFGPNITTPIPYVKSLSLAQEGHVAAIYAEYESVMPVDITFKAVPFGEDTFA